MKHSLPHCNKQDKMTHDNGYAYSRHVGWPKVILPLNENCMERLRRWSIFKNSPLNELCSNSGQVGAFPEIVSGGLGSTSHKCKFFC